MNPKLKAEVWWSPKDRLFYFHVKSRKNGQVVAQSEGYSRRIDCVHEAEQLVGGDPDDVEQLPIGDIPKSPRSGESSRGDE